MPAACRLRRQWRSVILLAGGVGLLHSSVVLAQESSDPAEACCFQDGACIDLSYEECVAQGGFPRGQGTCCETTQCLEACCLPDGTCEDLVREICIFYAGGTPMGAGSTCGSVSCPQFPREACCLGGTYCEDLPGWECAQRNGNAHPGKACAEITCLEEPWACCLPSGECRDFLDEAGCRAIGGEPIGPGVICALKPCPEPTEACCLFLDGSCSDMAAEACKQQGGAPQGPGTTCATVDCVPQACCINESCIELTPLNCMAMGGWLMGVGSHCETVVCDNQACCFPDGDCMDIPPAYCEQAGGWTQGRDTECASAKCEPWIACCVPEPFNFCIDIPPDACLGMYEGIPPGEGLLCAQVDCATIQGLFQACCLPEGGCVDWPEWLCWRRYGTPRGAMTNCGMPASCCGPDADGDTVGDACDMCPWTIPGIIVDQYGCPPFVPGDFDVDGDVDDFDITRFAMCVTGPLVPYGANDLPTACDLTRDTFGILLADFDRDGDVDQRDFGIMQRCYSGDGRPGEPGCAG